MKQEYTQVLWTSSVKEVTSWTQSLTGTHGVSPASDSAQGASGGTATGQGHRLHILIEGGSLAKLDQHDVTVNGPGVIAGVANDLFRGDVLLRTLINCDIVLAQTDLHTSERQNYCSELRKPTDRNMSYSMKTPLTTCSSEQQTQPSTRWPESHRKSGSQSSEKLSRAGNRVCTHIPRQSCHHPERLHTMREYHQYIDSPFPSLLVKCAKFIIAIIKWNFYSQAAPRSTRNTKDLMTADWTCSMMASLLTRSIYETVSL